MYEDKTKMYRKLREKFRKLFNSQKNIRYKIINKQNRNENKSREQNAI